MLYHTLQVDIHEVLPHYLYDNCFFFSNYKSVTSTVCMGCPISKIFIIFIKLWFLFFHFFSWKRFLSWTNCFLWKSLKFDLDCFMITWSGIKILLVVLIRVCVWGQGGGRSRIIIKEGYDPEVVEADPHEWDLWILPRKNTNI